MSWHTGWPNFSSVGFPFLVCLKTIMIHQPGYVCWLVLSQQWKWDVSYSWIIGLGADELAKVKFLNGGIGDLLDISDFLAYQAMFGCTGHSKTVRQDLKQFHPRFTGSHHLLMILLILTTGKRKFRLQQKSLKDFCLHQAERRETAMSQFVRDIPLKQIGGAPRRWVMPLPWEPSPAPWVATRKLWRNYPSTTFDYPWTSFDYPLSTLPKNLGLFWDVPGVTLNSFLWREFHWVLTDSVPDPIPLGLCDRLNCTPCYFRRHRRWEDMTENWVD